MTDDSDKDPRVLDFAGKPISPSEAIARLEERARDLSEPPGHAHLVMSDMGTIGIFVPSVMSAKTAMALGRMLISSAFRASTVTTAQMLMADVEDKMDTMLAEVERAQQPTDKSKLN
jgi:hypothetical protein